jgi:N-methylhydantoinase A
VFLDDQDQVTTRNVLSTPDDYSRGIMDGLSAGAGVDAAAVRQLMHGTIVATDAILEGKGARVGLITTMGFRDVLEIRRLRMPALYDIRWRKPPPLVPRRLRREIPERINAQGEIERALDGAAAAQEIDILLAAGVDAIAVCLINAYANGIHERRVRDLVRERNREMPVSLSSELVPEIKEYERTSTTVVNACVLPPVGRYLRRLKHELHVDGIATPLGIMQSSGGVMRAEAAADAHSTSSSRAPPPAWWARPSWRASSAIRTCSPSTGEGRPRRRRSCGTAHSFASVRSTSAAESTSPDGFSRAAATT